MTRSTTSPTRRSLNARPASGSWRPGVNSIGEPGLAELLAGVGLVEACLQLRAALLDAPDGDRHVRGECLDRGEERADRRGHLAQARVIRQVVDRLLRLVDRVLHLVRKRLDIPLRLLA